MNKYEQSSSFVSKLWPDFKRSKSSKSNIIQSAIPSNLPQINNPILSGPNPYNANNSNNIPPLPALNPPPFINQNPGFSGNSPNAISPFNPNNPVNFYLDVKDSHKLERLEEDIKKRRGNMEQLEKIGSQLLKSQIDIQEQVCQYQMVLEYCMEILDYHKLLTDGHAQQMALLRSKITDCNNTMNALRNNSKTHDVIQNTGLNSYDPLENSDWLLRNLGLMPTTPAAPFQRNDVVRITTSKFQPFNPRHQSSTNEQLRPC